MLYKTTTKLFSGAYQYKIVLICAGAHHFRSGDLDVALERLRSEDIATNNSNSKLLHRSNTIRTVSDMNYALAVQSTLKACSNIEIRVETPWISVYTNDKSHIDNLISINEGNVKYVSIPPIGTILTAGTIVMSKRDYDYRVTLAKTKQVNDSFVAWSDANSTKVKLTPRCRQDLLKPKSWGGTYFYITGDKALTMAKLLLNDSIARIERITKKIG